MKEIWKEVKGYEGIYEVSNLGNVKSVFRNVPHSKKQGKRILTEKQIKPYLNKKTGYLLISLSKNGIVKKYTIHQIVGVSFLGLEPDGTNKIVVDHINENKTDNNETNLRLVSNRVNCSRKKQGLSSIYIGVRKNKGKFESQIRIGKTRKYLGRFETEIEAHNAYQNELIKINEFN